MKIVFTAPDGATSIITPAPQADVARVLPEVKDMTEQQFAEFIRDRCVPAGATNISIVDDSAIPKDRTFRNALKHDLTFDIGQCVEITKERLRREREPLLAALDTQYIRAIEGNAPTAPIVAEKQRLRDITTMAHAGLSTDELKALKV